MDSSIVSPCEFQVQRWLAGWRTPRERPRPAMADFRHLFYSHTAVALAGVLSGALIVIFGAALIHLLLLRRKAKQQARASSRRLIALDGHGATTASQSDSDLGSLEAAVEEEKGSSRLSLNLTPNQPIFVDVEAVYGGHGAARGAQAGLQLILTPPTPRRVNREIP
ncbi:hypothetical protein EDB84DRAFT_1056657 [Lactarius hengduanensis]|nr:hypothetical protein EDB84DRAFT_1056657 [Lactarius hengduanensis]